MLTGEDSKDDAALIVHGLKGLSLKFSVLRVDTPAALASALEAHPWDIVQLKPRRCKQLFKANPLRSDRYGVGR